MQNCKGGANISLPGKWHKINKINLWHFRAQNGIEDEHGKMSRMAKVEGITAIRLMIIIMSNLYGASLLKVVMSATQRNKSTNYKTKVVTKTW